MDRDAWQQKADRRPIGSPDPQGAYTGDERRELSRQRERSPAEEEPQKGGKSPKEHSIQLTATPRRG